MKTIPISRVDEGIKKCITNSRSLLEASKKLNSDKFEKESTVVFYLALEEFGKAVLLRDKEKFAEHKDQTEIEVSDFFYDHNKKIEAAVHTIGSNIEIIKQHASSIEDTSKTENKEYKLETNPVNLFFIDYDLSKDYWGQRLLDHKVDGQNKSIVIIEKMHKKWDKIF